MGAQSQHGLVQAVVKGTNAEPSCAAAKNICAVGQPLRTLDVEPEAVQAGDGADTRGVHRRIVGIHGECGGAVHDVLPRLEHTPHNEVQQLVSTGADLRAAAWEGGWVTPADKVAQKDNASRWQSRASYTLQLPTACMQAGRYGIVPRSLATPPCIAPAQSPTMRCSTGIPCHRDRPSHKALDSGSGYMLGYSKLASAAVTSGGGP